uniref:G-protein coupled receptors family 1 profile domain-containing protein n=1 Tax=Monopterus albus TaxID=43700 RepID=A0A3Q3IZK6_MONAL
MDLSQHVTSHIDVPDHAHYIIGVVILAVGITGMVGNILVIYAFFTDFLMCLSQTPIFFINSMHKRWIFGKRGCELYAFCGALFGICSMMTLMVIAVDRYLVITRPLGSMGAMSRKKALIIAAVTWVYSMGWSLPPFFGWSSYIPEGLMTSCSWDYVTLTPSVRSYTMLLFTFVFFIPLSVIIFCYCGIFRAIQNTTKLVHAHTLLKTRIKTRNEWKMAKIALIVILTFVISWAPYSCIALTAFAGYADILTPYMNSVPAVIAKASAIHNPIIYAITHPKYRYDALLSAGNNSITVNSWTNVQCRTEEDTDSLFTLCFFVSDLFPFLMTWCTTDQITDVTAPQYILQNCVNLSVSALRTVLCTPINAINAITCCNICCRYAG